MNSSPTIILNTTLTNALQLENGAQVQLTSTSKISGNTKTGIVTNTSTNVYMQGMAIKLV